MIDDDGFVGLAKDCVKACQVLKTATEGKDVDSLSGPVKEAIESLEKYVGSGQPSANYNEQHQDHPPHRVQCQGMLQLPPGASPWIHRGMSHPVENGDSEDLGNFRCTWLQLRSATVSELPQGEPELCGGLVTRENEQPTRQSATTGHSMFGFTVRCHYLCAPHPHLTICST